MDPLSGTCVDEAAAATPGHRADFVGQQLLERDFLFRGEILRGAVEERDRKRSFRFEAGVDRRKVSEGLDEQQRREHQHQRHRNLRDHEPALEPGPIGGRWSGRATLPHDGNGIDHRHAGAPGVVQTGLP